VHIFQGLLLPLFGIGLLIVAWRGWRAGALPVGPDIRQGPFGQYRPNRRDNFLAFHFFFLLYVVSGFWLLVFGLGVLFGKYAPLPLN